jgi:hypothetical protein
VGTHCCGNQRGPKTPLARMHWQRGPKTYPWLARMTFLCAWDNFYNINCRQVIFSVARYYHPGGRGFLFSEGNISFFKCLSANQIEEFYIKVYN